MSFSSLWQRVNQSMKLRTFVDRLTKADSLKKRLYRAKKAFAAAYDAECGQAEGRERR